MRGDVVRNLQQPGHQRQQFRRGVRVPGQVVHVMWPRAVPPALPAAREVGGRSKARLGRCQGASTAEWGRTRRQVSEQVQRPYAPPRRSRVGAAPGWAVPSAASSGAQVLHRGRFVPPPQFVGTIISTGRNLYPESAAPGAQSRAGPGPAPGGPGGPGPPRSKSADRCARHSPGLQPCTVFEGGFLERGCQTHSSPKDISPQWRTKTSAAADVASPARRRACRSRFPRRSLGQRWPRRRGRFASCSPGGSACRKPTAVGSSTPPLR